MKQEPSENSPACVFCLYYREHAQGGGDCHRYPPAFSSIESSIERHHWKHPRVHQHNWCGEFRQRVAG